MTAGTARTEGERGATIVEMAIVLPLLLLLVIGMLELGLAFKSYLTVSAAARDAARVAAIAGNDPEADCAVLVELGAALSAGDTIENLRHVDIYQASRGSGVIIGLPNRYTLDVGGDPTDCDDWTVSSYGYPEESRGTIVGPTKELDIIGVRLLVDTAWITGFPPFTGAYTIDEAALRRLEPEAYE